MARIIDPLEDQPNTIQGIGGEENELIALGGDDTILGADLADFIRAGRGNDTITTGSGGDTVRFEYNNSDYVAEQPDPITGLVTLLETWGNDVWTDFSIAEGDKLDVSDIGVGEQFDHSFGIGELETIIANSSIVGGNVRFTWGSISITLEGVTSLDQLVASMFVFDAVDFDDNVIYFSETFVPALIHNDLEALGAGNDRAEGGGGNDTLYGEQGDDTLLGGTGDDKLYGGSGDDDLKGEDGTDHLYGGAGNDTLTSTNGLDEIDQLYGGAGNDTYIISSMGEYDGSVRRADIHEGLDEGIDTLIYSGSFYGYFSLGFPLLFAPVVLPDNVEWGIGTGSALFMDGNDLDNTLVGTSTILDPAPLTLFINNLRGFAGNDTIYGQAYRDMLEGGDGDDTLLGQGGRDDLSGNADNDTLWGGLGDDVLRGGTGLDHLHGEGDNDKLYGDDNDDVLHGGAGNDTLDGGRQSDEIYGEDGNDTIITSSGNDEVYGGIGNDTVTGITAGSFFFDGGAGLDTLDMSDAAGRISLTLRGSNLGYVFVNNIFNDTIKNVESAIGGKYADSLIGDAAANWLNGGLGLDTLTGGAGADRFVFTTRPSTSTNWDTIRDFKPGDDKFALDTAIFARIGPTLTASEFVTSVRAKDANDFIIYNRGTGALYYDADGSGAGAAVKFAQITAGTVLNYTHFILGDF